MFEFQKLQVYVKAKTFHEDCRVIFQNSKLSSAMNNQLSRAALSIPLNIAEGSAKFSKADRKNYFTTARGSVFECVAILDILMDENLITKGEFESRAQKADELSRILFAMIKNLESK
ncbi:MAG: four helix bundle protein [Flavobacteriales bacterium]|nr:four helix bundle protein [Flavobacteriales bacterium]